MRPRSSNAKAMGCCTSGSAATSSARKPSGRYICDRISSAGAAGWTVTGFAFKCRSTGLVSSLRTSGRGSSADAELTQVMTAMQRGIESDNRATSHRVELMYFMSVILQRPSLLVEYIRTRPTELRAKEVAAYLATYHMLFPARLG